MKTQASLKLLQIQVRSELPANCIGYADFLTEGNFPATGEIANENLIQLESLVPGTLGKFATIIMGF